MPSNKQRREAERLRLQRQLQQRREREVARRRFTLISSIVGTLVIVAAVVIIVVVVTSGGSSTPQTQPGASGGGTAPKTSAPQTKPATSATTAPLAAPKACATPSETVKNGKATYAGVTLTDFSDFTKQPKVASQPTSKLNALQCADTKVGTGTAASPSSTVKVQYTGFLYSNGKVFDASYLHGKTGSSFSLTQVVKGFTEGIGGTGKVAPMKVGGQRIIIMPSSLGYGSQAQQGIPANSTLVFVVDLLKVS